MTKPLDVGTPERQQHVDEKDVLIEKTEDAGQTRVVILAQDALDRYHRRGQLHSDPKENERLYDAGIRLRGDFHRAGISPGVISNYSDMVSSGSVQGFSNFQVEAYKRWRSAIKEVGQVAANEVITVCCQGEPVGKGVRMEILRRGLIVLAAHYGY